MVHWAPLRGPGEPGRSTALFIAEIERVLIPSQMHEVLRQGFSHDDDPALWEAAWREIVWPIEAGGDRLDGHTELYVQIGRCSHWLRPHQTRLTASGGFAWPVGYLGGRYGRRGLPAFDWYAILRWTGPDSGWAAGRHFRGKRRLVCRVAVPGRTGRHAQAVVHVHWQPGTLEQSRAKATRYYAFRRTSSGWGCAVARDLFHHGRSN